MSASGWLAALGARALGQQQALRLAPAPVWRAEADEVPTPWPSGGAALPGEAAPADPPPAARAGGPVSALATPPEVNGLEPGRTQPLPRSQAQPQPVGVESVAARNLTTESPRSSQPATAPRTQVAVPDQPMGPATRPAALDPQPVAAALLPESRTRAWPEPLLPRWTPMPSPEPQASGGDQVVAPPAPIEVQVHIGRVEFVAAPPPAPTPARRSAPQRSLAEYLQGGGGGRR